MTREDVIRQIVQREVQGLGLSAEVVGREAVGLYSAACAHFGTWETALEYAGVDLRRLVTPDEYTGDRVLRTIRMLCCGSYDLSAKRTVTRDRRLYEAARQHFGTWRKAMRAAGIELANLPASSVPRQLDKQQIIDQLRQRQAEGRSLAWSRVCLEDRALATAAKNAFRSWLRALLAAGIASDESLAVRHRKWDQQRVIDAIQARHREGKSLRSMAVRREANSLMAAARAYFGSWTDAVLVAGIQLEDSRPGRRKKP